MDHASKDVDVVRADARHLDALAPLFDAYRVFYGQPSDVERARAFVKRRLLDDGENSVFFVAMHLDDPVGFTRMWATHSSIAARPAWILEDLYVAPSARRRGVAEALMRRAEQHAREGDAVWVSLETAYDNASAQALYESLGYEREAAFWKYNLQL
jgi:ribosomal protein S18 acetylase RimI-like enzyme